MTTKTALCAPEPRRPRSVDLARAAIDALTSLEQVHHELSANADPAMAEILSGIAAASRSQIVQSLRGERS